MTNIKQKIKMKKAIVYLWRDSKNKMWYLGTHDGHNLNYAHSSTVMESFTMNSVPPYMKRRILAHGTAQEMIDLEHMLLSKVISRDDYYNIASTFPPPPMTGKDHPSYNHGKCIDFRTNKEKQRLYFAMWRKKPENKKKIKLKNAKQRMKPGYIEKQRLYHTKYYQQNKEKLRLYAKEYYQRNNK